MTADAAEATVRRRGLQVGITSTVLVLGVLGVIGTIIGCVYAAASGQVSGSEATVAALVAVPAVLLLIVAPAVWALARQGVVATIWAGIVCPLLFGSMNVGLEFVTLPAALIFVGLTLWWLFSRVPAPAVVDPIGSVPPGQYTVVALGHEYGPYDPEGLRTLAEQGQLNRASQLRLNGGAVFSAAELPALFTPRPR
ncbi:MAG: hypothetical protein QM597_02050 [Aeromicrobium sp.]|uniref:hypothetical protein n=1 Tax=Aeromicrobium sp. TaxID=1871063 RepID=UPI0039E54DF7